MSIREEKAPRKSVRLPTNALSINNGFKQSSINSKKEKDNTVPNRTIVAAEKLRYSNQSISGNGNGDGNGNKVNVVGQDGEPPDQKSKAKTNWND